MGSKSKLSHEIRPQIKREALYKLTPIYHKTAIGTWFKSLKTRLCILRSIFISFRVLRCYIVDIYPVKKSKNQGKDWTLAITSRLFLYKKNDQEGSWRNPLFSIGMVIFGLQSLSLKRSGSSYKPHTLLAGKDSSEKKLNMLFKAYINFYYEFKMF